MPTWLRKVWASVIRKSLSDQAEIRIEELLIQNRNLTKIVEDLERQQRARERVEEELRFSRWWIAGLVGFLSALITTLVVFLIQRWFPRLNELTAQAFSYVFTGSFLAHVLVLVLFRLSFVVVLPARHALKRMGKRWLRNGGVAQR
jgi:fumarate reductase subunit D